MDFRKAGCFDETEELQLYAANKVGPREVRAGFFWVLTKTFPYPSG